MASSISSTTASAFQFTHPGRGATDLYAVHPSGCVFQFTHPGRGATAVCVLDILAVGFNSRTPGGVRQALALEKQWEEEFQFTHPGRGATASTL